MSDKPNSYSAPQSNPSRSENGSLAAGDRAPRGTRREFFAWALYDWANSAYSTLLITTLMFYLKAIFPAANDPQAVFPVVTLGGQSVEGAVAYPLGIGLSMLIAAFLSPIVGALADARANKRIWFRVTALSGAFCGLMIGVLPPEHPWWIAGMFLLTSFFFELSYGFYNSFLPDIADDSNMNRVSSYGFALGYIGGGVAVILALLLIEKGDWIGIESKVDRLRAGLIMMGLWWGLFSLPAVFILRDKTAPRSAGLPLSGAIGQALGEVKHTLTNLRQFRMLAWFLIGFLFYNDAVQTVLTQASNFAEEEIKLTPEQLIPIIIMIQFVSMPGALIVGKLADRFGQKAALYGCLAVWVATLAASWWVTTEFEFWIMGAVVALVMGGIQSVSRAIMGIMTPANRTAEFFGFFNLSSKATSFIGPLTFAAVVYFTGSARLAIISLLLQLVIGWVLVSRVDVRRGKREADASLATTN